MWQTLLHHRVLQPAHSMRVPSESASQWLQLPKWDASGTSTKRPYPLQISMGEVVAPNQRQTCRNATSASTGAAAAAVCGASAHWQRVIRHWLRSNWGIIWRVQGVAAAAGCGALACQRGGNVSEVQRMWRAVAHWRVGGAALCPSLVGFLASLFEKYKTLSCIRHRSCFDQRYLKFASFDIAHILNLSHWDVLINNTQYK